MDGKNRFGSYLKLLIYLAVVVLLNVAGTTLFYRFDLTAHKLYSLSQASKQVVATLSEPLTVNVFFTRNLPAPHNNTEAYLRDLLDEYALHANRYFNYRFFDVSPEEGDTRPETNANRELARNYGIHPLQIQMIEKDEVKFQKAYMGLVLIHGDIVERIPAITATDRLEYDLTMAIQKLNNKVSALLGLPQKIQVKLFLSSSLEQVAPFMRLKDLPQLPEKIEKIVGKLNAKSYGKLAYALYDPSRDPSLKEDYQPHNLLSLKWPALSNGQIPPGEGVIGLVMTYGTKSVTLPLVQVLQVPLFGTQYSMANLDELEENMDQSLGGLIDINEKLGVLAGHKSLNISGTPTQPPPQNQRQDEVSTLRALISQSYTIQDVTLNKGIPKGLPSLIVARPTEPFTDYELYQIDQFLMQGHNLALFLDAFQEVAPANPRGMMFGNQEPGFSPLKTGLERLLAHYGVTLKASFVMDENCFQQRVSEQFGGGQRPLYFAPLIKNENINAELGFMNNINGLITLKASPLEIDPQQLSTNKAKAYRLFASSAKSWEKSDQLPLNPMFMRPPPPDQEFRSFPLAYLLQGEFTSYFKDKPLPVLEAPAPEKDATAADSGTDQAEAQPAPPTVDPGLTQIERQGEFIARGKPGKILLIGSAEMLKNIMLDPEGRSPNAVFLLNALDFLNNREDIAVMRSKEQRFNPLMETGPGLKTFVKLFNIAGLPVLVSLCGLAVWARRSARKRRIRMMFQELQG